MFDANMSHLPKGREFFCKVRSCSKDSILYPEGVRQGAIIRCAATKADRKARRESLENTDGI